MSYLISGVIFLVMGGLVGGYALFLVWVLKGAGIPLWIVLFISFIFLVILFGLVVAFIGRIREISKEDKDDYRNY